MGRSRLHRLSWIIASGLTVGFIAVGSVVVAGAVSGHWKLDTIRSGSMRPSLPLGSEVIATPESLSAVKPGQVLVFRPPGLGGEAVAHRVTTVDHARGATTITTKGDANPVPDQWRAVLGGTQAWQVRRDIPDLGYAYALAGRPLVRFGVLVIAVVVAMVLLLTALARMDRSTPNVDGGLSEMTSGDGTPLPA
ncbi:MAG: signal peptidase I [Acidimicrobiales bacterium]